MITKRSLTFLLAACAAVAGLLLPAAASAASLKYSDGTLVGTGEEMLMNGSEGKVAHPLVIETETLGTAACEQFELGATLTANNGERVEAEGTEVQSRANGCRFNGETHFQLIGITIPHITLKPPSKPGGVPYQNMELRYRTEYPGGAICNWTSSSLAISYEPGASAMSVKGTMKSAACGTVRLEGTFGVSVHRSFPFESGPLFLF